MGAMFEFVEISAGVQDEDVRTTRRRVKSQAMKNFRRCQRENAGKPHLPHSNQTGGSMQKLGRWIPTKRAEKKVSHKVSHKSSRKDAASHVQLIKPRERSATNDRVSCHDGTSAKHIARKTRHPPKLSWSDMRNTCIPVTPSTWGLETTNTEKFYSASQASRMFGLSKTFIHWLRPEVELEYAGQVVARAWEESPSPMILAALCLVAITYLDAVEMGPDCTMRNIGLYKSMALRGLSDRMLSPKTATTDITICILINLTAFEISRLSPEAEIHLQGLKTVIDMKGGKDKLGLLGLAMSVEMFDLLNCMIFNATLRHADLTTTQYESSAGTLFIQISTWLVAEQNNLREPACHLGKTDLIGLPELLSSVAACILTFSENGTVDDVLADRFKTKLEEFGQCNGLLKRNLASGSCIAGACAQAMAILYNLVVNNNPYNHKTNKDYADWLFIATRAVEDEVWLAMPCLRTWILLTGLSASRDPSTRGYYTATLARSVYQAGVSNWEMIKNIFFTFIKVKRSVELGVSDIVVIAYQPQSQISPRDISTPNKERPEELILPLERFDPLLRYGNQISESCDSEEANERNQTPDEIIVADHVFGDTIYSSDFWFTKR